MNNGLNSPILAGMIPLKTFQFATFQNIAAYRFVPLENLPLWKTRLENATRGLGIRGTILISPEGVNLFLAGRPGGIRQFLDDLERFPETSGMDIKFSLSESRPFKRLAIKIKPAIIPFVTDNQSPAASAAYIPPRELRNWLDQKQPCLLLDVRNQYEVQQGSFHDSASLPIDHFREFPAAARRFADELIAQGKEQTPVVTFCTGGIRCEKAAPYLKACGLPNVVQLEGGILRYFEECGSDHYRGDCFVFDDRVALKPDLLPRGIVTCSQCQAQLTPEDQLAPEFLTGHACPYCFDPGAKDSFMAAELPPLKQRNQALRQLARVLPGKIPYTNRRFIEVHPKYSGLSVLDFLHKAFPFVGRTAWQERLRGEFLWRDTERLQPETVVQAGERLTHLFPNTTEPDVNPRIEVLFEDQAIVVVAKGAPLPVHPCGQYNLNTLTYFLDQIYRPQKLRLAHRIDANTSGLVVLSRSPRFARKLQPQFEKRQVAKVYLVRVQGAPAATEFRCYGKISSESLQSGARMVEPEGVAAETQFSVVRNLTDGTTILEARPITGRTNQIRVHLWDLGYPICGDPMYLAEKRLGTRQTLLPTEPPMCLHAWKLGFRHPLTEKWIDFEADPPEWAKCLA